MTYKILIVEDESEIRDIVAKYLENSNFNVCKAKDGFEGLSLFEEFSPDLMILDVMMPGITGFDVLKNIRRISNIPIIMLTAKQEEVDRLTGFEMGVDDYVSKPFSVKELVKRVEVILKRVHGDHNSLPKLICKDLVLDTQKQILLKSDKEIEITSKEYKLLYVFFNNQNHLLAREQLIEKAFGDMYDGFDRNIDSYIKKIRRKIESDTRNPKYLKTKYGSGYIFGGDEYDN
ncbi:MAG: response regulator transcription factor [Acidaminobacteraceae bacterium]